MAERGVDGLMGEDVGSGDGGTYPDAPTMRLAGDEQEQEKEKQTLSNTGNIVVRRESQKESWVRAGVLLPITRESMELTRLGIPLWTIACEQGPCWEYCWTKQERGGLRIAIVGLAIATAQDVGWRQGRAIGTAYEEAGASLGGARRWLGLPGLMVSAHGRKTIEHSILRAVVKSTREEKRVDNAYSRSPEALRR